MLQVNHHAPPGESRAGFFAESLIILKSTPALFSSAVFALYHVSIIGAWFSWWVFTLCMAGLFVGGLIFCRLDHRGSILPSWLTHASANLAINTIGMVMFGIL